MSNNSWNCPNCGTAEITSKFCPECGTKKPETGTTQKTETGSAKPQKARTTESFNIGSNVNIARIITQIEQIASTHKITLPPTFSKIKARANDPMLYVSLIGEFSVGKSSLMNAWLGDDLLKTDILPATTAAPTLLKDNSEYQISTLMKNGDVIDSAKTSKRENFKATSLDYLYKVSADENYSKDIKLVSISYPNEVLRKKGFALIDTPGANADKNERHKKISGWAVEELCDVAIVILDANKAYPESLENFIRTYLNKSFKKCVFVMTKVDLIRSRREGELERLILSTKTRIEASLGIEIPEIIPFSPQLYLDALAETKKVEENKVHFISEFEENTAKLFELLYQKRDEYISLTLSEILRTLISEIQEQLNGKKAEYERKQKLVAANMLPNLDRWFGDRYDRLKKSIDQEYAETKTAAENWLKKYKSDLWNRITQDFNSLDEVEQIERFMQPSKLKSRYLNPSASKISNYLNSVISTSRNSTESKLRQLSEEFSNVYRNLATIDPNLPVSPAIKKNSLSSYSFSAVNKAAEEVSGEKIGAQIGAGAIGAVIGSFIVPGLGTVIGGALGGWLGKFFVSAEDIKKEYSPALKKTVNSFLADISKALGSELSKEQSRNLNALSQTINDHKISYRKLIEKIQKQENKEASELSRNAEEVGKTTENLSMAIKYLEHSAIIKISSTDEFSFLRELPEIMQKEALTSESNTDEIAALLGGAATLAKHII